MDDHFVTDKLEDLLCSEHLANAVADSLVKLLRSKNQPELLCGLLPEGAIGRLEEELCVRIQLAICKAGLPMEFAKVGGEIAGGVISKSPIGKSIARHITGLVIRPMARELEEYIINDAHDIILGLMDKELLRLAHDSIADLSNLLTKDDQELKNLVSSLCLKFMNGNAPEIAECIGGKSPDESEISIREETPEDYEAVSELVAAVFAGNENADGKRMLTSKIRENPSYIPELSLLAFRDGKVIGHIMFCELTLSDETAAVLAAMSVFPGERKRLISAALIDKAREIAAEKGYGFCVNSY